MNQSLNSAPFDLPEKSNAPESLFDKNLMTNPYYHHDHNSLFFSLTFVSGFICLLSLLAFRNYHGAWRVYFLSFGLYLLMVSMLFAYLNNLKKPAKILGKSRYLYNVKLELGTIDSLPSLRYSFSLDPAMKKAFCMTIRLRNIRHLYLDHSGTRLIIDGDFRVVCMEGHAKNNTVWHSIRLDLDPLKNPELLRVLSEESGLTFEPAV